MIKNSEAKEIKKLIKKGFDLELISFELDIPIEEIMQCKLELEKINKSSSIKTYSVREIIDSKNKQAHLKMQQMREQYRKLFFKVNKVEIKPIKKLTTQEIEFVDSVIAEIDEIVKGMKNISKKERRKGANIILTKIKKIENYQLTIEQSERLHSLMQSENLEKLNLNTTDKIDFYINRTKRTIVKKLTDAVDNAQVQTEDLQELKILEKKLTTTMQHNNPIYVGAVKSRIENKILKINQKIAFNRIRNDVPTDIAFIITEIANGTLDIEIANEIIDKEAKKRVENKPKTKFSLTEEQEKKQILIQIRTVLMEKPEQYHIENPKVTIMQMQELCGGDLEQSVRTVVKNLTCIKDFERAKNVCDSFSIKDKDNQIPKYIRTQKNEIRNAELGDIVLKGLNMSGTEEDDRKYFELIEKGLKMGNVKLSSVPLGKSQDGLKNIYLSDIWETQEKTR